MTKRLALGLLVIAFALSIFLRLPSLQRSVSNWRDHNTPFFLIPMLIWDETGGGLEHRFMHVTTFNNPGDKNNPHLGALNSNGICYYHSFPTFSLVLPYYTFKVLHAPISPMSLRIFNLVFGFITVFLIFKILNEILPEANVATKNFAACFGAISYLFSPGALFYHGNGYTHHVLIVPLTLSAIYFYIKYYQTKLSRHLVLFLIFLFLSLITEWIAYFFAFGFFLIILLSRQQMKKVPIALAIVAVVLVALACFLYPPISKFGFHNFLTLTLMKFTQRSISGDVTDSTFVNVATGLFHHFKSMHLPTLVAIIGLGGWLFFKKIKLALTRMEYIILCLIFTCVWVHHIVFINFTLPHHYSILFDLSYLSIGLGVLMSRIMVHERIKWFFLALIVVGGSILYLHYNPPGPLSIDHEPYNYTEQMARDILPHAQPADVIFIQSFTADAAYCTPMAYHLRRNYYAFQTEQEVYKVIHEKGIDHAIMVFTNNFRVTRIKKL